ncbi:GDYXXLXY domain-containing protein [Porphyrobacter sp. YT40]|uniref:GDYXXLXY domain-containing protein n=1 Tax=Porphyrobacter sp. YT40 TaxID=2547601 RepID=UPI001142B332|nr:GDYXXLXY domain-containing protein [Porphyrobacter sp. YT40]QDH33171.1 GDYXXLXY domain-containing protein [Porphyrobacter sp. YT40]
MKRRARLVAAALPLCGLGALWAWSAHVYDQGTEWEVPIMGYDPRDYLRGHYVEFTYDWPGLPESDIVPAALCLEGEAPTLARVSAIPVDEPCGDYWVRSDSSGVYGWDSLNRGRLYIGQDRAAQLQQQLRNRDQRGIVTIRQREDGSFTPIAIRFRPLTPAEIAERDAPPEEPFDPLAPPAVMDAP